MGENGIPNFIVGIVLAAIVGMFLIAAAVIGAVLAAGIGG